MGHNSNEERVMAGQWQGGQWQPEENVQPGVQPHVQLPPFRESPGQQYPGQYPQPPQFPYPPPQAYWQPPVQVNVYGPRGAVTQGQLGCGEEVFHWLMIIGTCGLWLPVYLSRKRSMRSVTTFR
jgi:hypothetical protein